MCRKLEGQRSSLERVSASCAAMDTSIAENGVYTCNTQTITGNASVDQVIHTLPLPELGKLLRHIRDWNSTIKTSGIAQTVLHAILKLQRAEDVRAAFVATSKNNNKNNHLPPSLEPNDEDEAMPSTQGAVKAKMDGLREVALRGT